ncbi:MAG TPA: hypothetical protein VJQ84_05990, partial [Solirubrobacterales bacterium]|nr:hypothetical protein [Solirubrobacterales bacterium]
MKASHRLCLAFMLTFAIMVCLASNAAAETTFGSPGSGAGQLGGNGGSITGVAVDPVSGDVYVADWGNNRIDVFEGDGDFLFAFGWGVGDGTSNALQTCTTTCFSGIVGSGSGQINNPEAIAIDSDPSSPSYRDIYVSERDSRRVQKFSPNGDFILMFGGGVNKTTGKDICTLASGNTCGAGAQSGANGAFFRTMQVAAGP